MVSKEDYTTNIAAGMRVSFASLLTALLPIAFAQGHQTGTAARPPLTTPASTAPDSQKCIVSGYVINVQSGETIRKATVRLTRRGNRSGSMGVSEPRAYAGMSEPDGSFRFEAVEPGDYMLSGERWGYVQTQYGSKRAMSGGTVLNLQPGQQLADLKLALIPQAVISGRVLDEDGDPAGGVMVQAIGQVNAGGKTHFYPMAGGATPDDTGAFRLANLRPGKYYVVAQSRNKMMRGNEIPAVPGKPDVRPVSTFYPDSLSRSTASLIDVKPGQEFSGVEIKIRAVQTFFVKGKIAGDFPEENAEGLMVVLIPRDNDGPIGFMQQAMAAGKDRSFEFSGIAPGSYVVSLAAMRGNLQQFARQMVEVGSSNVSDLVVNIQPGIALHGSIELEGMPPGTAKNNALQSVQIMLRPEEERNGFLGISSFENSGTKADGTFTMEGVMPEKVQLRVMNKPDGTYLKSVRFAQQELLGKPLDLTQGSGGDLRIVFRYGAAEVDGTVQTTQNATSAAGGNGAAAPATSAAIMLVPDDLPSDGTGIYSASANQDGGFSIKDVSPGRYHAFAFDSEDQNDYSNPDLLK